MKPCTKPRTKLRTKLLLISWLLVGFALSQFALSQEDIGFAGIWEGVLEQESESPSVVLRLEQENRWQGSIDIPSQNIREQALTAIVIEDTQISFEVEGISDTTALFEGVLNEETVTGSWTQDGQTFALTLNPQTTEEAQAELTEAQILELGQSFTEQLYNGEYERLAERFTDEMREAMDAQALEQLWQQLKGQIGGEAELLEETASFQLGLGVYQRNARFGDGKKAIVQWVVNDKGIIEGFTIRPDRSG